MNFNQILSILEEGFLSLIENLLNSEKQTQKELISICKGLKSIAKKENQWIQLEGRKEIKPFAAKLERKNIVNLLRKLLFHPDNNVVYSAEFLLSILEKE